MTCSRLGVSNQADFNQKKKNGPIKYENEPNQPYLTSSRPVHMGFGRFYVRNWETCLDRFGCQVYTVNNGSQVEQVLNRFLTFIFVLKLKKVIDIVGDMFS